MRAFWQSVYLGHGQKIWKEDDRPPFLSIPLTCFPFSSLSFSSLSLPSISIPCPFPPLPCPLIQLEGMGSAVSSPSGSEKGFCAIFSANLHIFRRGGWLLEVCIFKGNLLTILLSGVLLAVTTISAVFSFSSYGEFTPWSPPLRRTPLVVPSPVRREIYFRATRLVRP